MTTLSGAFAALKARVEQNQPARITMLRWQNEDGDSLPDTPAPFLYSEIDADRQYLAGFGGGRGSNLWRSPARFSSYAFVPRGEGLQSASDIAEAIAALFRGYRDNDLQCFDATVYPLGDGSSMKPPGLQSAVDNYYCAVAEVSLFYDLVG